MAFSEIIFNTQDGIATITLNRPKALNAITPTMLSELQQAFDDAAADDTVGVVVLTGEGRAFSAGVDLKALNELKLEAGSIGSGMDAPARNVIETIQTMPKVVIAKINGFCFTGALEIALSCDLIVIANEAKLGDTHTKWGLRPTWGMSARLPNAVGLLKARELSFTAAIFTGTDAAAWGLANRAVPIEDLDATVESLAKRILLNSRESIAAYKTLYNQGASAPVRAALDFEASTAFTIGDTQERLAEFL